MTTPSLNPPTLDDIRAAAQRIEGTLERTPTRHSATLSEIAGCDVYLKFENLQFTSSFKERGALNKLLSLTPEQRKRGIAAMSAGNHAQGVAYHAGRLGIPTTIVMPEFTPFVKVKHTKGFGARVVLEGATLTESFGRANQIAQSEGLAFVHPYDDPVIVAGTGTIALEMLADVPALDAIVVPIGGGGLISGIAVGAQSLKPGIEIFGAQTYAYPSMYDAIKGASLPCSGQSVAEGIAVKAPGELTRRIVTERIKDIFLVGEQEIEHAIVQLLEIEKTVVEGAGATGFAAVTANRDVFRGRKLGVVLSGGNIDMRLLSNVILRELARVGRMFSVAIAIDDRPGVLARIAALVGEAGGNILEVSHNRMIDDSAKSATLGMLIEARDNDHAREIRAHLEGAGFAIKERAET
ncbi:MAG: threonine ammonia-lyase [Alphaproteobacteria bacterium]|nr:threonine ammonia-lyase [Alphaproteobacteria bacterium]MBV9692541.1 threonine ammonia-lyase [Alphaproteobacteria bacterium]